MTEIKKSISRCGTVVIGSGHRTYFNKYVSQHLDGAGLSPTGSVGQDLNLRKLSYQYLTTRVAVVLVVC